MPSKLPVFDIFSGTPAEKTLWVESVEGLPSARERLKQISAAKPGKYFLFSAESNTVVIAVDTSAKSHPLKPRSKSTSA